VFVPCLCAACGVNTRNQLPAHSDFILYCCTNDKCDLRGVAVLLERKTSCVIWTSCVYIDGQPTWPVVADREGRVKWPQPHMDK